MDKEFALEHSPKQSLHNDLLNYPSVKFDDIKTGYYYIRFMKYPYDFIVRAVKYEDYADTTFHYSRLRGTDYPWKEIDWGHKQSRNIDRTMINSGFMTYYKYQPRDVHSATPASRIKRRKTRRKTYRRK